MKSFKDTGKTNKIILEDAPEPTSCFVKFVITDKQGNPVK